MLRILMLTLARHRDHGGCCVTCRQVSKRFPVSALLSCSCHLIRRLNPPGSWEGWFELPKPRWLAGGVRTTKGISYSISPWSFLGAKTCDWTIWHVWDVCEDPLWAFWCRNKGNSQEAVHLGWKCCVVYRERFDSSLWFIRNLRKKCNFSRYFLISLSFVYKCAANIWK